MQNELGPLLHEAVVPFVAKPCKGPVHNEKRSWQRSDDPCSRPRYMLRETEGRRPCSAVDMFWTTTLYCAWRLFKSMKPGIFTVLQGSPYNHKGHFFFWENSPGSATTLRKVTVHSFLPAMPSMISSILRYEVSCSVVGKYMYTHNLKAQS